jgi:hypothetical protein
MANPGPAYLRWASQAVICQRFGCWLGCAWVQVCDALHEASHQPSKECRRSFSAEKLCDAVNWAGIAEDLRISPRNLQPSLDHINRVGHACGERGRREGVEDAERIRSRSTSRSLRPLSNQSWCVRGRKLELLGPAFVQLLVSMPAASSTALHLPSAAKKRPLNGTQTSWWGKKAR